VAVAIIVMLVLLLVPPIIAVLLGIVIGVQWPHRLDLRGARSSARSVSCRCRGAEAFRRT
jgi:hypothetical protein